MLHGGFLLQSNDKNFLLTHWKLFFSLISRELFLRERNWQYRRNCYNAEKTKQKKQEIRTYRLYGRGAFCSRHTIIIEFLVFIHTTTTR